MLGELITMYVNGFTAFWGVIFGGGMLRLILIAVLLWRLFCRRGNRCCCEYCGCWCGRCQCAEVRIEHAEAEPVKKKKPSGTTSKAKAKAKPES